jgi:hypothetical protein
MAAIVTERASRRARRVARPHRQHLRADRRRALGRRALGRNPSVIDHCDPLRQTIGLV